MSTLKELIKEDIPYLSLYDITESDWQQLDFELEEYDRQNKEYNLDKLPVLKFIVTHIYNDKIKYDLIPTYIRNGTQFKNLVKKYNIIIK